jgi:hypothetical protein
MKEYKSIFQTISYLQYPLFICGLVFVFLSLIIIFRAFGDSPTDDQVMNLIGDMSYHWNIAFFLFGLAVSFSTLQDTTKTQNKLSENVWRDPRKGVIALALMSAIAILFISLSIVGMFMYPESILNKMSYGFLAFGIAYVGVLKAAIEMFEHHREDRKPTPVRKNENN